MKRSKQNSEHIKQRTQYKKMPTEPQWMINARANGLEMTEKRTNFAMFQNPPTGGFIQSDLKKPAKKEMISASFTLPGTWMIPVWLESEANRQSNIKGMIQRKAAVKKAIFKALGPYWKVWGPIGDAIRSDESATIIVTRIGGSGLDHGNLWRSIKSVEDSIAIMLGVDDGMKTWRRVFDVDQEPGPLWGCKIQMRLGDRNEIAQTMQNMPVAKRRRSARHT